MTIRIGEFWVGWGIGVVSAFVGSAAIVLILLLVAEKKNKED